ncbi:MAG: hypothetical protein NTW94_05425 [Legionellales bacterium]|nr:hypothetical protein [Legionellales bacterium]
MFRHANIAWSHLLQASVAHVLSHYSVTAGVLVLDDSDKVRSRNTSKIAGVHKVKDKKTGGWFNGQEFIFLILVTGTLTIPVGFRFYIPNPALKIWKKTVKEDAPGVSQENNMLISELRSCLQALHNETLLDIDAQSHAFTPSTA